MYMIDRLIDRYIVPIDICVYTYILILHIYTNIYIYTHFFMYMLQHVLIPVLLLK